MNQHKEAIQRAAEHWAGQMEDETANSIIVWLANRPIPPIIIPKKGWQRSKLAEWGQAQKLQRGLRALWRALHGEPSRQWLAVWEK